MSWWESWFGEEYLDLYPHRDVESARREAAFALARLSPHPTPLLDLCCGSGRHSLRFREAGIAPVALDYSAPLLELARRRDPRIRIVRGDMRSLPFPNESFRSVVNFFTSFGYFLRETENLAVVAEIERVLRDDGVFLCDTVGREWALARLVPEESRKCGDKEYRIRRWWNAETSRFEKEIEVRREGSTETFRESVRAYTASELAGLLAGAGLSVQDAWGGFDGCPAGPESPRLIVMARKAA
ncbi:MAG TPA: class I SAM-dependent methyltransferase [Thermoanaerobaculia bacterium]|jgi:ubiquinone/menaquinone biosynthesis C-methylase UbiE|nr:class I SAM-dependent methyltransferase [Thermoanaerobaculia bacterium]